MKCTYCDEQAYEPGIVKPPMCERHYEIALLVSRVQRRGKAITVESVTARLLPCFRITIREIPALLADVQRKPPQFARSVTLEA